MDVSKLFAKGIALDLKIEERDIESITEIRSSSFREEDYEAVLKVIDEGDFEKLKTISLTDLDVMADILSICEVSLKTGLKYLVVIFDPFELFAGSTLCKISPISKSLI